MIGIEISSIAFFFISVGKYDSVQIHPANVGMTE
jgi:hypothetical protein